MTIELFTEIQAALGGDAWPPPSVALGGSLPSRFAVTELACASVAAAGAALAEYAGIDRPVRVSPDLASAWFLFSIRPIGWELAPTWDAVAGDYEAADGWIRLHTNAPHHRAAALRVLGVEADRSAVAAAVGGWRVDELESAVVEAGGCAAALRDDWSSHPQGQAVGTEPLVHCESGTDGAGPTGPALTRSRESLSPGPLSGIRVLDLTRVLAGPVTTRALAGWGADVLRLDPPFWNEPALEPEVTLGKRCARIDLRAESGRALFVELLSSADVLVHGYRPDALDRLGFGWAQRQAIRPGLIDVSLCAYGWSGPWAGRRGFDSLVQMSTGIAAVDPGTGHPAPLPVQALDHATGWIMAAAAIRGLTVRAAEGVGSRWRCSLARTAALLVGAGERQLDSGAVSGPPATEVPEPMPEIERTVWGDARRLAHPVEVDGAPLRWSLPARPLGSDPPVWA